MLTGVGRPTGVAVSLLGIALLAEQVQAPAEPKFDVVSIRVVPRNTPPTLREIGFTPVLPGGQYVDSRTGVPSMIAFAYKVKNFDVRLLGLPKWATQESYAVAAKPGAGFPALPPRENEDQVRLMMRAMLADRFHLTLHTETRQEPIFNLEIAKGGVKIKEVQPPIPPAKEVPVSAAMGNSSGRMIGVKSTMRGLAAALAVFMKHPVVDATGLDGYYDFDVRWNSPEAADGLPQSPSFGAEGEALLISNLQDQFGLHLKKTVGSVEYYVVDHIERPTEN